MVARSRSVLYSDPITDYMTGCVDHQIIGGTSFLSNYPIYLRIYRGYGTNTGSTVYIPPSDIRPDFKDLRFADSNFRLLPYWVEYIGSNYADVWVSLYTIPTTGCIIKVLFGGNICSASDGTQVFTSFFEDASSGSLSGWSSEAGVSVTATTAAARTDTYGVSFASTISNWKASTKALSLAAPYYMYLSAKAPQTNVWTYFRPQNASGYGAATYFGDSGYIGYYNGSTTINLQTYSSNTWYRCKYLIKASNFDMWIDDSQVVTNGSYQTGLTASTFAFSAGGSATWYFDNMFAFAQVTSEPTHGLWGSLEDL